MANETRVSEQKKTEPRVLRVRKRCLVLSPSHTELRMVEFPRKGSFTRNPWSTQGSMDCCGLQGLHCVTAACAGPHSAGPGAYKKSSINNSKIERITCIWNKKLLGAKGIATRR